MPGTPVDRSATVFVAGHGGLVGSAIWRHLQSEGFTDLVGVRSAELDLRDPDATDAWFARTRPAIVIDAAARVGGILANSTYPAEFLSDNLRIQLNPVSYTHLDVYKRQQSARGECADSRHADHHRSAG